MNFLLRDHVAIVFQDCDDDEKIHKFEIVEVIASRKESEISRERNKDKNRTIKRNFKDNDIEVEFAIKNVVFQKMNLIVHLLTFVNKFLQKKIIQNDEFVFKLH